MNLIKLIPLFCTSILFISCNSNTVNIEKGSTLTQLFSKSVDTSKFNSKTVTSIIEKDCKLTNGQTSTCYEITIEGFPANRDTLGPNCPTTIKTEAKDAGKWFKDGVLYDVTGEFIKNLNTFYSDSKWKLYDEKTGKVNVTNTQEACEAASRKDEKNE